MATEKTNDLKTETRAIASIVVGERFREGVGDEDQFKALQESIIDLGVLEPIVVEPDGTLVDGYRRLEACRARAWQDIRRRGVTIAACVSQVMVEHHNGGLAKKNWLPDWV